MDDSDQIAQNEIKYCRECGEKLKAPKKCNNCGAYQKFNWIEFFKSLSSGTAFIIVIISMVSLFQTCQEKNNAEEAFKAAKQALEDTQKAKVAAETAKEDAIRESKLLVQNLESAIKDSIVKLSKQTETSSEAVKDLKKRINEERSNIEAVSNRATAVSSELRMLDKKIEFQQIIYDARNYDKKSYDQLKLLSSDSSYPYHEEARVQYSVLQKDPFFIAENERISSLSTDHLESLLGLSKNDSLKKLAGFYSNIDPTQPYMKFYYIIYIAQRRVDISLGEKLDFLIRIISTDENLLAAKIAEFNFWKLTDKKHVDWYDEDLTLKYWKNNKDKYK